jgi:hypothetical protein
VNGGVPLRVRAAYVGLAVLTILIGLIVHRGVPRLPAAARDITGDALWAMMMVWWVSAIAPRGTPWARGAAALAICFAVELSQRLRLQPLDALRRTTVGHLFLGSGFDPRDFLAYTLGAAVAVLLLLATARMARQRA